MSDDIIALLSWIGFCFLFAPILWWAMNQGRITSTTDYVGPPLPPGASARPIKPPVVTDLDARRKRQEALRNELKIAAKALDVRSDYHPSHQTDIRQTFLRAQARKPVELRKEKRR